ncbi:MAG: peptidoglycan-binding protein [Christensenellales bacterium]
MLLKEGDTGATVASLQRGLRMMCCDPNGLDGIFGPGCTAAVKKFQNKMGIEPADGICGDDTWNTLVSEIYEIQIILSAKGYDTGGNDGKAGPKTYEAVLQFQRDNGLTADGMVGDQTWAKLMAMGDGTGGTAGLPLKQGSRGSKVLCAQYALRILCCSPGTIDGTFGSRTYNAVKKFQSSNGLAADGIIGEATWEKLCTEIQNIQQALKNKGYAILVDGLAGLDTYEAVMQFQADNGLSKDGQVGAATREKLFGTAGGGVDGLPLKEGQSGEMITFLQRALRIAVINCPITGTFDAETKTCVIRYQGRNSLTADGIVGVKTWEKLRENVRRYQTALQNKGYDVGGIDGIAGDKTYNAILKFQSDNGLDADGMCGTQTQTKLFGASQGGGTTSSTLKLGSNGSLTRYLQIMLNTMGYSLSVDGIFGPNMEAAIKDYQSKNGLDADGICGGGTWSKLFSQYRVNVSGTGVQKFVNVAKHEAQIGFHEDNGNNINPYGQWYGSNGSAWCAMFVSWCAYQAGILNTTVPRYSYTPTGAAWYRNRGKYHKRSSGYTPKVGDTVFFFDPSKGRIAHTGIVTNITSTVVYTIEGNASDGVIERNYSRSDSYIDGYGSNGGETTITANPPTHIQDVIPFIREIEDILADMGESTQDIATGVCDFLRRNCYNGAEIDEWGDRMEWSIAIKPIVMEDMMVVINRLGTKKNEWIKDYIKKNPTLLNADDNMKMDLPHFSAVAEAYILDKYRTIHTIPPHWCGWGGDLASAAYDLEKLNPETQQEADADAAAHICKETGRFNLSDIPCDADGYKIALRTIDYIESGNNHALSDSMVYYYTSNDVHRRAHHFINDFGISNSENATYDAIRTKIVEKMDSEILWGTKGKLNNGKKATTVHREALCRAFAKYCIEHR